MRDEEKSVFNYKTFRKEPRQPERTDQMIANMVQRMPIFRELLEASTLEAQTAIIERTIEPSEYWRLVFHLVMIEHFYKETDKRLDKALQLAKLKYWLTTKMPQEWQLDTVLEFSPGRYRADALFDLGSVYEDMGDFSRALDYYQQAEEWFQRDDEERHKRGITQKSEYDYVVMRRDVRANLFEHMALLYKGLRDLEKFAEYGQRMHELDEQQATVETRFNMLMGAGNAARESGDLNEALRDFQEALALALEDRRSEWVSALVTIACHEIGETLCQSGLYRQALRYHRRAMELNLTSANQHRLHFDHLAIGEICEKRPDLGSALEHYQEALLCASVPTTKPGVFMWQTYDGKMYRVIDPDMAWSAALAIGRVSIQRDADDQADRFIELAIELSEVLRSHIMQDEYRIGLHATRLDAYNLMIQMHSERAMQADGDASRGHAIRAWRYVERARSRAFLDLLSISPIQAPHGIPERLQKQEAELLEHLRTVTQRARVTGVNQKSSVWDEYKGTRTKLEHVWEDMAAMTPSASAYIELRQGQPLFFNELRDLLEA